MYSNFLVSFQLPAESAFCLGRAFILGIVVSSQALLARQKRNGFERNLILFSAFSILMAAEVLGLCLSLMGRDLTLPGPPASLWIWYPTLSIVGLLAVALSFDFVRAAAGRFLSPGSEARAILRKRSRYFVATAAIILALAPLLMQEDFPRELPAASFSQMRGVALLLHGLQVAGLIFLGVEAYATKGIWLSRAETRVFILGVASGLLGVAAQVIIGPAEFLTSFAYTLFVGVFLRDSYRRSELDAAQASEERTARMLLLHRITGKLNSTSELPQLYAITVDGLVENLGADSGALYVRWERDKQLQPARIQGAYPSPVPLSPYDSAETGDVGAVLLRTPVPNGVGIIGTVAATGAPLYIASAREAAAHYRWPTATQVNTSIALPLRSAEGIFGVIQLVNKRDGAAFSEEDLRFASLVTEQAGVAIHNARLQSEIMQRQRAEEQMRIAREIQLRLIPSELPKIEGISLGAEYLAAEEVGGDYFDFYQVDHDHLGVAIFDVAGRGVPGALLMAITSTFFNMAAARSNSPAWVLNEVNAALSAKIRRGLYVTATYGVLRLSTLQFTFVCGGHTDVMLVPAKGGVERHKPRGAALGLLRPNKFRSTLEQETLQLNVGDTLVLYTDGVVEARNAAGEQFGEGRLAEVARAHAGEGALAVAAEVKKAVQVHAGHERQDDDLTVVAIRIAPEPAAGEPQPQI